MPWTYIKESYCGISLQAIIQSFHERWPKKKRKRNVRKVSRDLGGKKI